MYRDKNSPDDVVETDVTEIGVVADGSDCRPTAGVVEQQRGEGGEGES